MNAFPASFVTRFVTAILGASFAPRCPNFNDLSAGKIVRGYASRRILGQFYALAGILPLTLGNGVRTVCRDSGGALGRTALPAALCFRPA